MKRRKVFVSSRILQL